MENKSCWFGTQNYKYKIKLNKMEDYYLVNRVSNSYLSIIEGMMLNRPPIDLSEIFEMGSQFHYSILEPHKLNHDYKDIDKVYKMRDSALKDPLLNLIVKQSKAIEFEKEYYPIIDDVEAKMKLDGVLNHDLGLELKSTSCKTEKSFMAAIDHFSIDRQCAWYIDGAKLARIFIFAVSKENPHHTFKYVVTKGDSMYHSGKEKYKKLLMYYKNIIR